ELRLPVLSQLDGALPFALEGLDVLGMQDVRPADVRLRPHFEARAIPPSAISVRECTGTIRRPNHLGHRLREIAVALLARSFQLGDFFFAVDAELLCLLLDLLVFARELDEDADLRSKHVRI